VEMSANLRLKKRSRAAQRHAGEGPKEKSRAQRWIGALSLPAQLQCRDS